MKRVAIVCGLALSVFGWSPGLFAQAEIPAKQSPAQEEVLTNEAVIKLVKAGLQDGLIANKILTSKVNFDLSTEGLLALKKAGVSDYLVQVMQGVSIAQRYGRTPGANPYTEPAGNAGGFPDLPQLYSWRGLKLDKTTPEEALQLLGQPDQDKDQDKIGLLRVWVRFTMNEDLIGRRYFRILTYKKRHGLDELRLAFYDGKLVMIHLELKGSEQLDPNRLEEEYGVIFRPSPDWAEDKLEYYLWTEGDRSWVWARADKPRSIVGQILGSRGREHQSYFPGWVKDIQLVSHTLRGRAGALH